MRIAAWGPLGPGEGPVGEESALVLAELARHVDVVAVVRDRGTSGAVAPAGVAVVAAADYGPFGIDLDLYALANSVRQHAFVHAQALERPGVAVLHEPSLAGLYAGLCGSETAPLLADQAAVETGGPRPALVVGGRRRPDPLSALFSPRVASASLCTLVDSRFAAEALAARAPGAAVAIVARAARPSDAPAGVSGRGPAGDGRDAGIVVAGQRAPRNLLVGLVEALLGAPEPVPVTVLVAPGARFDVALLERAGLGAGAPGRLRVLEAAPTLSACGPALSGARLVVAPEWPSYGGTSTLVAGALSAGTPVVVTDLPQYAGLDEPAVTRLPAEPAAAAASLSARLGTPGFAAALEAARPAAARLGAAHDPAAVADQVLAVIERYRPAARYRRAKRAEAVDASWPPAVNAIGSFEATTGLAEAARRSVKALVGAGVRVALEDYDYRWAPREAHRLGADLRALPAGRPYDRELCYLNVNELHILARNYLRPPRRRRHLIASWFWELPELPRYLHEQVARVDEIWTPSEFVAEVFRPLTGNPVRVVPCVVEPARDESLTRADFGLDESRRCYFFNFDANSTLARKNPFAVIEAFRRAFGPRVRDEVQLVMKTMNLARRPEAATALRARLAEVGGVVVEDDLAPAAMGALTALCDVYVSLHRGEGFGLGMAEAMYFAKPVVATGYSGNLAFMSAANSCLVGYRMTTVRLGELRYNPGAEVVYEPGQYWAEPDVDEAAAWMRHLHDHPAAAERIGAAGAATIRERCSSEAVGRTMADLLGAIGPE